MTITVDKMNSFLPHHENVMENIRGFQPLSRLPQEKFWIAGGYALALLFGKRDLDGTVQHAFYGDIDLYCEDNKTVQDTAMKLLFDVVVAVPAVFLIAETQNAYTFQCMSQRFQLVKNPKNLSIQEQIEEFDILNCKIALQISGGQIAYEPKGIKAQASSLLEITPLLGARAVNQDGILRISKYVKRWGLTLAPETASDLKRARSQRPMLHIGDAKPPESSDSYDPNDLPESGNCWDVIVNLLGPPALDNGFMSPLDLAYAASLEEEHESF